MFNKKQEKFNQSTTDLVSELQDKLNYACRDILVLEKKVEQLNNGYKVLLDHLNLIVQDEKYILGEQVAHRIKIVKKK